MVKKLGEVCLIQSGGTPSRSISSYWENGTIPWVKISDFSERMLFSTEESITVEGLNNSSAKVFPKGTLLYTIFATLGEVNILGIDAATNQAIAGITITDCNLLTDYLYYYLISIKESVIRAGRGVAQNNINLGILRELPIQMPSIEKQLFIAKTLDSVDKLISLRKKQLQKLDDLVKSRFVEMFGDETNPKNWPLISVDNVADVSVGVVIKPAQYYTDSEHGIKAFRSMNIGPMTIKNTDWVYFSKEGNEKNAKTQLMENDLLIVRSGAPGTACVVTKEYEGCNAIDIIIARPNTQKINPLFLCYYTNLPHGRRQIEEGTGGAAQQHFNVGKYNKLKVMLPSMDKQNEFVTFVKHVDKSRLTIQDGLNRMELLKQSLMQKYFG